jgi:tetratricopeptide (TPR) repeat protein
LYRASGNQYGQANALNGLGWSFAQLGDYERAGAYCEEALRMHQATGNRRGESTTWDSAGFAHHKLCRYPEAIACYERAVHIMRELGDPYTEAIVQVHIGDTRLAAGQGDLATDAWQTALDILDRLDHPDAGDVRKKLHALGLGPPPGR